MIESIHNRMLDTSVIILGIVIMSAFREFCVHVLNTLRERETVDLSEIQAHPGSRAWGHAGPSALKVPRSCDLFQYACISAVFPLPPVQRELPLLSHGFH